MDLRNVARNLFYSPQSVYDADVEKYFEGSLVKHLEVSFLLNFFFFFSVWGLTKIILNRNLNAGSNTKKQIF